MDGWVARICTSFIDVPDKIAIAVYFSGCSLRCKNCQNPELWNRENGTQLSLDDVMDKIKNHPLADSIVFLGGEPTDQIDFLIEICSKIKQTCDKEVALYTGREFENLPKELTSNLDMIVCGPYREELHVDRWPASSNQRVFKKGNKTWTC